MKMIPDPILSVRAILVLVEIILIMQHERTQESKGYATELVYRAKRAWVLDQAKLKTHSDAGALDKACQFWLWFRTANWEALFENCTTQLELETWFENLVTQMLNEQNASVS